MEDNDFAYSNVHLARVKKIRIPVGAGVTLQESVFLVSQGTKKTGGKKWLQYQHGLEPTFYFQFQFST